MKKIDEIIQYCKNTGFIYQGSEIYGGLANTFDYGPLGSLLKRNIKNAWTKKFVNHFPQNVLLDGPILLNNKVWHASGHIKGFSDPLIECRNCNQRYRADKLLYDFNKIDADGWKSQEFEKYINDNHITCPACNKFMWTDIRSFNMMFQTYQGVVSDSLNQIYLRPENAQNVFIQFKNILRTTRNKIPFGICHIGKAFRNEITPGNFIFRTREFEQMELEYFVKPNTELEVFSFFKQYCKDFLINLGIKEDNIRLDDHRPEKLSHYSNATTDIQYNFPWGFDELWGIASRTNFDLTKHQEFSGIDMQYLDPETGEKYIPYVVEPSVGVERLVLAFLTNSLETEILSDGKERDVLKIHPYLSPYKIAILPLSKRDLSDRAKEIYELLSDDFDCIYDETQSVGKRYRRQDLIGTPFCLTVDYDTLNDNSVTIRFRDSMEQIRINIDNLKEFFNNNIKL